MLLNFYINARSTMSGVQLRTVGLLQKRPEACKPDTLPFYLVTKFKAADMLSRLHRLS